MVKVFQMNDHEWFAGETLESCIKYYFEDYMCEEDTPERRAEYFENPYELTEKQLNQMKFHDPDGWLGKRPAVYTFRKALDKMIRQELPIPTFFAGTEY